MDSRNSTDIPRLDGTGALSDTMNPWELLAGRFNDYKDFAPQNGLIQYKDSPEGPIPKHPYRASSEDYTCLAASCWDLNPCNHLRRSIIRDGAWVKEHYTKMRGFIAVVLADFNRSGEQSGKDMSDVEFCSPKEQQRWATHSTNKSRKYPGVVCYAFYRFELNDFHHLGKEMQLGTGRDNSILGETEGSHARANQMRKAAHKQKKRKIATEYDAEGGALAKAISSTAADERRVDVLKFLFTHGNAEDKKKAYAGLSVYLNTEDPVEKEALPSDDEEQMSDESNKNRDNKSRASVQNYDNRRGADNQSSEDTSLSNIFRNVFSS